MMMINSIHKVFTLSLFFVLFTACESTKSTNNTDNGKMIAKILMEKTTMGSSSTIEISKKELLTSSKNREGKEDAGTENVTPEVWNQINSLVSSLDLNEMGNWEAPTQARFYDGAKAVTITIESGGETYVSQSFDEGKPPAQLQKLYDYLESLVNQ